MDKIAIVVQRYSKDVNGGAELHARLLAERLMEKYEVEVLTTCALDYITWDNYYPEGKELINGIKVIRFKSESKNWKVHRRLARYLRGNLKYTDQKYKWNSFVPLLYRKIRYRKRKDHKAIFEKWIDKQGPTCPDMMTFLEREKERYKVVIFFTYLYYPTYRGLPLVSEKSIFIPTAHDEPSFHLDGFRDLFSTPRFIMYNSISEKELVESVYPTTKKINSDIAGVGFDIVPSEDNVKPLIKDRYFVYIGRIDNNKGCKELISYFLKFRKASTEKIFLVMIGKNYMEHVITDPGILYTGFVSDKEKLAYLQHSQALIIPSRFESLSMVTLEAMTMGKPVLANGHCEVLKSHIDNSSAGYIYYNRNGFNSAMSSILNLGKEEKARISRNGISYVSKNYKWETIVNKFIDAIDYVAP